MKEKDNLYVKLAFYWKKYIKRKKAKEAARKKKLEDAKKKKKPSVMASSGNNSATSYSSGPRFHERFAQPSFNSGFNVKLQKPKGLPKIVAPVPGAS